MKEIIKKMVEFLENANDGAEYSTSKILYEVLHSNDNNHDSFEGDLFDLDIELRKEARKHKIKLDSSRYNNMDVGLPYNIPYVIHKKKD